MRVAVALSSLRTASRLIEKTAEPTDSARKAVMAQFLLRLPSQGQWMVVLALEETAQGWIGAALGPNEKRTDWRYSDEIGLVKV